jgi:hypothetical protein
MVIIKLGAWGPVLVASVKSAIWLAPVNMD